MVAEIVSLVIAALALVVSIIGTVLANRRAKASERLAIEARDDARAARTDALWSAHIESVHGVLALDPAAQSVAEPLRRLRVTGGALVDGLPDWPGLDRWIGAEHALGSTMLRLSMERSKPDDTADERLAALKPAMDWSMALVNNLRRLRMTGYDADAIRSLTEAADTTGRQVHERNGWDLPGPPSWRTLD